METGGTNKSIGKDSGVAMKKDMQPKKTTMKDIEAETQVDSQPNLGMEAVNTGGTKKTGEPVKGPRKKQHAQQKEWDEMVTLIEGDLEQIADAVTLVTKINKNKVQCIQQQ